jgi:hypothetical protein
LFNDILSRIIYPAEYPKTWAITLLMGVMLNFMYLMLKSIRNQNVLKTVNEN